MDCDYCGDSRLRDDVKQTVNSALWEKDVLHFCKDRGCERRYAQEEHEDDNHKVCHWCDDMISTVIQKSKTVNGKLYHQACWEVKVRTIEEQHNAKIPIR